jgi:PhnB protein
MPDDALDNVKVDQLDQVIDALLAGSAAPVSTDPELAALVQIAASLRDLPGEHFQKRLKSDLQRRANMTTSAIAPVREGLRTVTPFITVPKAPELIEFLKRTFDAEETSRHPHGPDGFVAGVKIGDSDLLIMGGESVRGHERIGAFHVFVPDCDATYKRAIEAGGISLGEPADRPYGERSGFVKDAVGNYWYIATRLASNVAPEGVGSVLPYAHPAKALPFIEFLKRAFGAQAMGVYEHEGRVMHAAVRIGNAVLEMGESPDFQPSGFYLRVDDCDAVYRRAIEAGATSLWPPTDQAYGDRSAGLMDPFGYQWMPATPIKNVR